MKLTKEVLSTGVPVFQTVHETAQGGFTLDTTGLTIGNTLAAGTPMIINEATRLAKPATLDTDAPNGLLYQDTEIQVGAELSVVIRGTVYNRRTPAISATLKDKLPLIVFSQSF